MLLWYKNIGCTPSNLFKLDEVASGYISFGSSAMNDKVGLGPFYGRPYGGTAILTKRVECH